MPVLLVTPTRIPDQLDIVIFGHDEHDETKNAEKGREKKGIQTSKVERQMSKELEIHILSKENTNQRAPS